MSEEKEMTFLDHLDVLRGHLVRCVIAILVFAIVAFIYMPSIFHHIILAPARPDFITYRALCKISTWVCSHWPALCDAGSTLCVDKIDFVLQSRTMSGQFTMHITASLVCGLVISFPYVVWELWRFVKPALYPREKKGASGGVLFVTILFTCGVLFGYYIVSPLSINFLANYKLDPSIQNFFDITSYISTICLLVLGSGLMFQLPVLVYVLTSMGMITPEFMRKYRKHAVILNFILAALVTPSPDIFTMTLVALPLLFLYELSIFISGSALRKQAKAETMNR
ncbi:MAG: twin-arginine translocase subunit TatC [Cytophagaceae bacterium]